MSIAAPRIGIVMGSDSDWPTMVDASKICEDFAVACEARVLSAHRTPTQTTEYATAAAERGLRVLIAGAGGAAHLPGVLAAHTRLPVIGVPIAGGALQGMDALLAIVQMPRGVPVATVGIGRADNAALLAMHILALGDDEVAKRLEVYRRELAERALAADRKLGASL